MVLSNLKKSFYNNTFLAKQKRLKEEIDRNMTMLGINLEVFKFQAQQMLRKKKYSTKAQFLQKSESQESITPKAEKANEMRRSLSPNQ